MMLVINA